MNYTPSEQAEYDAAFFRASRGYKRPAVERYLRVEFELPDGGVVDFGVEDREEKDWPEAAEKAMHWILRHACDCDGHDARDIAKRIEEGVLAWFPHRYWFAEVWTPGSDGVKRYQVIQPAVVGGFRR
jgi:hypothetical protein